MISNEIITIVLVVVLGALAWLSTCTLKPLGSDDRRTSIERVMADRRQAVRRRNDSDANI